MGNPKRIWNRAGEWRSLAQRGLRLTIWTIAIAVLGWSSAIGAAQASPPSPIQSQTLVASLPAGNAITDGGALLRNALPIDNPTVRRIQSDIEDISNYLRGKRWSPIASKAKNAARILNYDRDALLDSVRPDAKAAALPLLDELAAKAEAIREAADERDRERVWIERRQFLSTLGTLEESMVEGFPYEVPEDYANLPQLKGRATIAFETSRGPIVAVVDGYSAPVTAGNFVDLVQRGFYDGLKFTRAEDSYVLQFGDPPGKEEGFVDPKTGEYRAIPLEILVDGDEEPIYGFTLEELGIYQDLPALPFSSYGTLAMARPEPDPNGASSQVFFFLLDNELTPPGLNLLDGRYAVFGYTVDGRKDVLGKLSAGDQIISAKVIDGAENLVLPQS